MKKVTLLLIIGFVLITGCLVYLVKNGVSLRINKLIKPSVIHSPEQTAQGVFKRMFPEFQDKELWIVGLNETSSEAAAIVDLIKKEAKTLRQNERREDLGVVITTADAASEIGSSTFGLEKFGLADKKHFSLTVISFKDFDAAKIPDCEKKKRLDLTCLRELSIKAAQRKMSDPKARYFFLNQYNDKDYFLFLQDAPN